MNIEHLIPDRTKFARLFYGLAMLYILMRWKNQMLFPQLQQPELTYLGTDITYIFFSWAGISHYLVSHYWAGVLFDISLAGSALASFLFTRQKISCIIFSVLLFVYIVVGYSFLCFHKHNLTGLWFGSLMFWAVGDKPFTLLFELVRYYALFTYASAGFWKFFRGIWNLPGHFSLIVKNDAVAYLVQHPNTYLAKVLSWLIANPALLDNMMILACFIQVAFVIGFFTKKLDWFFLLFALSFHLLSLLLLRAYFFEFAAILITLIPFSVFYKSKTE